MINLQSIYQTAQQEDIALLQETQKKTQEWIQSTIQRISSRLCNTFKLTPADFTVEYYETPTSPEYLPEVGYVVTIDNVPLHAIATSGSFEVLFCMYAKPSNWQPGDKFLTLQIHNLPQLAKAAHAHQGRIVNPRDIVRIENPDTEEWMYGLTEDRETLENRLATLTAEAEARATQKKQHEQAIELEAEKFAAILLVPSSHKTPLALELASKIVGLNPEITTRGALEKAYALIHGYAHMEAERSMAQ